MLPFSVFGLARRKKTNTNSKQILDDNPILLSHSTIDIKEELCVTSNHTTTGNDTVPNWIQSGGQVSMNS